MRMNLLLIPLSAGLLALPALAATPSARDSSESATADGATSAADPNERICRTVVPATGSRLGARRKCGTRAEWGQMDDEGGFARRGIEGIQGQRSINCNEFAC